MKAKLFVLETLETLLSSVIVLFIIYSLVAMPELVWGASMEPSFHTGERILVDKITKQFRQFQRGDVVVLNPPGNNNVDYVKRIIGIPGDVFKIYNCRVYVSRDGARFELVEKYLFRSLCTSGGTEIPDGRALKLGSSEYVVMGDNRTHSADSRMFGVISTDRIVGRVIFRFWPLNKIGFI